MKRVVQLFVLTSVVLGAVACGSGDAPQTPQIVKIGVDNASGMKKKPASESKPETGKPGETKPGAPAGTPPAGAPPAGAPPAGAPPKPGDKPKAP